MHRKSLFTPLLFVSLFLTSCEFHCSVGDSGTGEKGESVKKDGITLYNGIKLDAKDVTVTKAFLITNDGKADRIDDDNTVDPQKGVKLIIQVEDGWKETGNKVFLGASMKVMADNGQTMLDEKDLFGSSDETGLSAQDAKGIGLSVTLSSLKLDRPVTFDVTFRVWDKKGNGVIEGSYTFHTK